MTQTDLLALLPLLIVAAASLVALLASAAVRRPVASFCISLVGFAAGLAGVVFSWPQAPRSVAALLVVDRTSLFSIGLILSAALVVALLSSRAVRARAEERGEYYALLLLGAFGASVLCTSAHFASFFLGQELLSVSLYCLIAYRRESAAGIDAGMKYLVLGGVSSSFLLFGMALLYADLGTMQFGGIAAAFASGAEGVLSFCGAAMIIVGLGFKLAVVPFHLWTPDVYAGAPVAVSAFVATVSKGAVFSVLLRFFPRQDGGIPGPFLTIFALIAAFSMLAGNLLALRESNVKRMLAYSSIAHLGYLLVAFAAGGPSGNSAAAFYLVVYFTAALGSFGAVAALSPAKREADSLRDFHGLAWRRPWLAGSFTIMLLSLAGLPLTAGFLGKLSLFLAGIGSGMWHLGLVLAVASVVSVFYYLRVISIMFRTDGSAANREEEHPLGPNFSAIAVAGLALVVLWLGVFPGPLLRLIRQLLSAAL